MDDEDSNIAILPVTTRHDLPVARIIQGLDPALLDSLVCVGWDKNGELYFASTTADGGNVMWLFELAKRELMKCADEMED